MKVEKTMTLRREIESLLEKLADQQAIPDDSWRAEWKKIRDRVPETSRVVPAFERSPSGTYELAIYDGFDNVWTTVKTDLSESDAIDLWNEKTSGGTKLVSFDDIDYYKIRPRRT